MPAITSKTTSLLVVDPRPDDYQELAAELQPANFQMRYATCGDEALWLSNISPAGLWLINFRLPDIAGVELLAQIRSRDAEAACVLVSDVYSPADEVSARQFGATLYGCKPLHASWLHSIPALRQPRDRNHPAHGPAAIRDSPGRAASRNASAAVPHQPPESQ